MDSILTLEYIAGFFDGEGCASIVKTHVRKNRRMKNGFELTPSITITQKKRDILERIYTTFNQYQIGCYLYNQQSGKINRLKITGIKRVKKFCETMIPYTVGKRRELEILLDYCNYRLSLAGRKEYSNIDLEYFNLLQQLKIEYQ